MLEYSATEPGLFFLPPGEDIETITLTDGKRTPAVSVSVISLLHQV